MLRQYLPSFVHPTFDWIQVEVTSFCDAACVYCPRTVYRGRWLDRHMTLATFEHLIPAFKHTNLVYLQGWGEPFLNPHFFFMAKEAKKAGCLVGTTTNGMSLDDRNIGNIIRSGLDVLTFSLAHTDLSHDHVRRGASLNDVLDKMRDVATAKKRAGKNKPAIHVAYVLLQSIKDDVKRLPYLMKWIDVEEVVISTLDFIPSPEFREEVIFPQTEEEHEKLSAYLEDVRIEGTQRGVPIHYSIGNARHRRTFCSENIQKSVVVSATGDVSPCVFTNMPLRTEQQGSEKIGPVERLIFGNITEKPLDTIWKSDAYKKFRRSFRRERLASSCEHCPKLYLTCEMEHLVPIPFLG